MEQLLAMIEKLLARLTLETQRADAKNSQKSHKYVVSNIYSIDLPRQIGP